MIYRVQQLLRFVATVAITVLPAFPALLTSASADAAGALDASFGSGGRASYALNGGSQSSAQAVAMLPAGKMLLVGFCTSQAAADYCLRRLNANGSTDSTFATNGESVIDWGGQDFPFTIAVAPDGKIIVGGGCNGSSCLVRYTASGGLDLSFGVSGKMNTGMIRVRDLRVRGDGKIAYVGECFGSGNYRFCVGRANANGTLDAIFNSGSVLSFLPNGVAVGKSATSGAMAIAADGSVYAVGGCDAGSATTNYQFCVAKVTPAGLLDTTFGASGSMTTPVLGVFDYANSAALQTDGKLLVGGTCKVSSATSETRQCVVRYNATGFDGTYGNGQGYVAVALGSSSTATGLTLFALPDGKSLIIGFCSSSAQSCATRLRDDGTPDPTFNGAGTVWTLLADPATVPAQTTRYVNGGALYGNDKLVLFGYCGPSSDANAYSACLARMIIDAPSGQRCTPDFDGDGQFSASTDGLILLRIMLGMNVSTAINGAINPAGSRNTSTLVRDYLFTHCGINAPL